MTTKASWPEAKVGPCQSSAARQLAQKFQDFLQEAEVQILRTRSEFARLSSGAISHLDPNLLLTASTRDLEIAAASSPPRVPEEDASLRIRFVSRTSIGSPQAPRMIDVMLAFALEVTEDRMLFRFEDRDGAGREGWLRREAVPLEVGEGDLLQIKVMAQGMKTWLDWHFAPQPARADYERALESFPPWDES